MNTLGVVLPARQLSVRGEARESMSLTEREFRSVARLGVDGAERNIRRQMVHEHRAATDYERGIVEAVKSAGGLCRPAGMSPEEWENRLPRTMRGGKRSCRAVDEVAQEFADRGMIADAYEDTALDFVAAQYQAATSKADMPDAKEIRKAARRIVDDRAKRAARELVASSRRAGCQNGGRMSSKALSSRHAGLGNAGVSRPSLAARDSFLSAVAAHQYVALASSAGLTALSIGMLAQQESTGGKLIFGLTTAVFGLMTLAKAFETF